MEKIDFVITWLDYADQEWQKTYFRLRYLYRVFADYITSAFCFT